MPIRAILLLPLLLAGCGSESRGFVLPPGDVAAGRDAVVAKGCLQCHFVDSGQTQLPATPAAAGAIRLGGPGSRVRTYGELVTAIIHPGEATGAAAVAMPDFNEQLSVRELVDITTFLRSTYGVWAPHYYPHFPPE